MRLLCTTLLFMAAALPAQTFETSPRGYGAIEGSTSFNHFTTTSDRRFQQIDGTHVGNAFLVQSLGFRRNGTSSGGGSNEPPRTMNLEISMGFADMGLLTNGFDGNYLPGSRLLVFTRKQVNMPDWTGLNGSPSPFDFVVPFDQPFGYVGAPALVVDFTYDALQYTVPGVTGGSSVDREYVGARNAYGSALGSGCVPSTGSRPFDLAMRLENNGPGGGRYGMRMRVNADDGPSGALVSLNIDFQDRNMTVPGLCATLHAGTVVTLPLGTLDAGGSLQQTSLSFPYSPVFTGVSLVTQLLALDGGQTGLPVVVSNGETTAMPNDPSGMSHACVYHWTSLPGDTGTLFFGGGMVLRLGM